jgi:hypothetical protein
MMFRTHDVESRPLTHLPISAGGFEREMRVVWLELPPMLG